MKESFERIKAWVKEHPWLAAAIAAVVVLGIYLYLKSRGAAAATTDMNTAQPTGTGQTAADTFGSAIPPGSQGAGEIGTLPQPTGGQGGAQGGGVFQIGGQPFPQIGTIPFGDLSGFAPPTAVDLGAPPVQQTGGYTNIQFAPGGDLASIVAVTGAGPSAPSTPPGHYQAGMTTQYTPQYSNIQFAPQQNLANIVQATGGGGQAPQPAAAPLSWSQLYTPGQGLAVAAAGQGFGAGFY